MKIKIKLMIILFFSFLFMYLPTYSAGFSKIIWDQNTGYRRCSAGQELVPGYRYKVVPRKVETNCYEAGGRGYSVEDLSWYTTSGRKNCTSGKEIVILENSLENRPRNGRTKCLFYDSRKPDITFNLSGGYTSISDSGKWTNKDVTLVVSTSDRRDNGDSGAGIGESWININGVKTDITAGKTVTIDFTREGEYNIEFYARDKADRLTLDGSNVGGGNDNRRQITIKIDKSAPGFVQPPTDTTYIWRNNHPSVGFKLDDVYEGKLAQIIVSKTFDCNENITLPPNGVWLNPVTSDGIITGDCTKTSGVNCTSDNQFNPNQTRCDFSCISGYTKGSDNKCYASRSTAMCTSTARTLSLFKYDAHEHLLQSGSISDTLVWKTPAGVNEVTGVFQTNFNTKTLKYEPLTSSCTSEFACPEGTHTAKILTEGEGTNDLSYKEVTKGGELQCINNNNQVCCDKGLLTTPGAGTPCDVNPNQIKCEKNPFCQTTRPDGTITSLYTKDIEKFWNGSRWKYRSGIVENNSRTLVCGTETPLPNSDGDTCDPRYYLTGTDEATYKCIEVPIGEYSGQENSKYPCTGGGNDVIYTSNGSTESNCAYDCKAGSIKKGGLCVTPSCNTTKPANATYTTGTPTTENQAWVKDATNCGFSCTGGYTGTNCEIAPITGSGWRLLDSNCDINDITIGTQTWAGCNSTLGKGFESGQTNADIGTSNYNGIVGLCYDYNGNKTATCTKGYITMASNTKANTWFSGTNTSGDSEYVNIWGKYYTWSNSPTACPTGRHVPSDAEWEVLETNLNGGINCRNATNGQLCDGLGWKSHNTKTNTNNLANALKLPLAGFCDTNYGYTFYNRGYGTVLWSSTPSSTNAFSRDLQWGNSTVYRFAYSQDYGFSVRCIKD